MCRNLKSKTCEGRQAGRQAGRKRFVIFVHLVVLVVVLVVEQGRVCAGATSTPWHLEALVQIIQEALSTPQTAQQRIHRGAAAQECAHILCVQLACLILQPGDEDTTCRYRTHMRVRVACSNYSLVVVVVVGIIKQCKCGF